MDWELVMAFALGAGLGSCLTFGIFYIIEDGDEDTEESKS